MASCAACLQPILRAQRFVLDGTEVFHAACAGQAYRSKLRMSEVRVRELEDQLASTRQAAARVESEANRLRNESTSHAAKLTIAESRLATTRAELELAQERLQATQVELQAARSGYIALRAELEAVKRGPPPEEQKDDLDASALRFKMLELD